MCKLSEQINRKFIDIIDVDDWEIETDSGWVDIVDVKKTIIYKKWIISTENGLELICADDHIVFNDNNEEIFVKDCIPGKTYIQTKYGLSKVISVLETNNYDNMYDIEVDSNDHTFYTNDILSHNTITTVGYVLHYILFNEHKNVGILANRGKTARGILSRLKESYRQLPFFLQSGVKEWNKGSIILENGCTVFADATSESASRSEAISLLILDEFAFVDNNKAEDFMRSVYPTISSGKNSQILVFSCVTDDSFVFTNNGIKHMKNFVDDSFGTQQGYQIPDYKIQGHSKLMDGCLCFNNGVAPVYRIESMSSWLDSTDTHKYFACKKGVYDWFPVSELEEGDWISILYGMEQWGSNDKLEDNSYGWSEITPDIAYLFGLYLSEGNISEKYNYIDITCGDDVTHIFNALGLKYYCYDELHYRLPQRKGEYLLNIFKSVGFEQTKAPFKTIPDRLMEMSRHNIIAMLQGIMDGDGYSRKDKGTIGISLSSLEMIKQIRMLFVNFGILSMYQNGITPPTKLINVESEYHRLELNKKFSQVYYEKIGFRFNRKSMNIYHLDHCGRRGDRNDIIPASKKILIENNVKGIWKGGVTKSKPNDLSRQWLLDRDLGDNFPEGVLDENIKWEQIKSKKYIGDKKTYDFSLPDSDDFFAHGVAYNAVITHQTPHGMNHFYKLWEDAKKDRNQYVPYEIHWSDVPGRDLKFKEETISNIGEIAWMQEYECLFVGSGGTLISSIFLQRMVYEQPIREEDNLKVYHEPQVGHKYACTVDSSEGLGLDYHVIQMFDITNIPYRQAAIWRSNTTDPHLVPDVINNMCIAYNNPPVLVEVNIGQGTIITDILFNTFEYENLIMTATYGRGGQQISYGSGSNVKFGIKTSPMTKRVGCSVLKSLIESDQLIIEDFDTISELTTFIQNKQSYEAEEGCNDDIVMSLVLFAWLTNQQYFKDLMDSDIRQGLNDPSIKLIEDALLPFGHIWDGGVEDKNNNSGLLNGMIW